VLPKALKPELAECGAGKNNVMAFIFLFATEATNRVQSECLLRLVIVEVTMSKKVLR
jgi:hypothetical protein